MTTDIRIVENILRCLIFS